MVSIVGKYFAVLVLLAGTTQAVSNLAKLRGQKATRSAATAIQALERIGVPMNSDDKNMLAKDIVDKGFGHAMYESFLQFHTPKMEGKQAPTYEKIYKTLKEKVHPWVNIRDAFEIVKDARNEDTQEQMQEQAMEFIGPGVRAAKAVEKKMMDGSFWKTMFDPNADLDLGDISAPVGMGGLEDIPDIYFEKL